MTVAYVGPGTSATGTTSAAPAYPASGAASDVVLTLVGNKPYTSIPTNANFALARTVTSGAVDSSVGAGSTRTSCFVRYTSTSTGTETFSVTSGTPTMAQMLRFSRGGAGWSLAHIGAGDTDETGTSVSASADVNPWAMGSSLPTYTPQAVAYGGSVLVTVGGYYGVTEILTATGPTGTWTLNSAQFSQALNTVAYGNSVWVVGGEGGTLATATDPTSTWTSRTSQFGTSSIKSIAYGNGVWVAVGVSGKISTATDPTGTWTARSALFGGTQVNSVAYGNGVWVAVGSSSGKIATATDPTGTWTTNNQGILNGFFAVAYGNGVWVGVCDSGAMYTATDPTSTWTSRTSSFGTSYIYNVAYGGGTWVATGQSGKIATATDPTGTWTNKTVDDDVLTLNALTYTGSEFVTLNTVCQCWYSATPATYTPFAAAGDMIAVAVAVQDDVPTHTSQTVTLTGCTLSAMTWLTRISTTSGQDGAMYIGYCTVDSGTASGAITYTATGSVSGKSATSVTFTRLRETSATAAYAPLPTATVRRLNPILVR